MIHVQKSINFNIMRSNDDYHQTKVESFQNSFCIGQNLLITCNLPKVIKNIVWGFGTNIEL